MSQIAVRFGAPVMVALAVLFLLGAAFMPPGFISVDEFVYHLGARALVETGGFATSNGLETFDSSDLVFLNMVNGPNGLVPQYPVGSALVGAPFHAILGVRGLIVLNALAAVALLFVTRALVFELYGNQTVAIGAVLILALATYFADYAWAVWPHMPSALCVTLAALLFWRASGAEPPRDLRYAAIAGLVVGVGFLFRTDTFLIVPAFGVLALLYAKRPLQVGFAGLAGLLPALAVAAVANEIKFGTFNPVSYGTSGGATNLGRHLPALIVLGAGVASMGALRFVHWRSSWALPVLAALIAGLAAAWFTLPQAQNLLSRYAFGAWNLVADMRLSPDNRPGVQARGDGTVQFWGLPKKALGQSLPWLGLLLFVLLRPWGERRKAHLFTLSALIIWTLPFFVLAWHGGLSSNMRYFLPILPLLAGVAALGLRDLARMADPNPRALLLGALGGTLAVFLWIAFGPAGYFGAHQILSLYAFLAVTLIVATAALVPRIVPAAQIAAFFGLGMAAVYGPLQDVTNSWAYRDSTARTSLALADTPNPSVIYGPPSFLAFQIGRDAGLIAQTSIGAGPDIGFIQDALSKGYAVYMIEPRLDEVLVLDPNLQVMGDPIGEDAGFPLYRIGER
ncbi:MAG: glycosyltransferase family 39 protein [Pseudomonadota bacterium]